MKDIDLLQQHSVHGFHQSLQSLTILSHIFEFTTIAAKKEVVTATKLEPDSGAFIFSQSFRKHLYPVDQEQYAKSLCGPVLYPE